MKWQDLLTTYWGQVTLVLAMIAFFIQRLFNLQSRKVEISYSLFQQNRINSVNTFFATYSKVEFMLHNLNIWDVHNHNVTTEELDKIIWTPINELKKSVLELKIYFSMKDHIYFQKIMDNIILLNNTLSMDYFDYNKGKTVSHKVNEFNFTKDKIIQENNNILEIISDLIRKSYFHK